CAQAGQLLAQSRALRQPGPPPGRPHMGQYAFHTKPALWLLYRPLRRRTPIAPAQARGRLLGASVSAFRPFRGDENHNCGDVFADTFTGQRVISCRLLAAGPGATASRALVRLVAPISPAE